MTRTVGRGFVSETSYTIHYAPATILTRTGVPPWCVLALKAMCYVTGKSLLLLIRLLNLATVIAVYINLIDLI